MKKDRVSREDVRNMEIGKVVKFTLPNWIAVYNARSTICTMKRLYGFEIESVPTKEPFTVAYRRLK